MENSLGRTIGFFIKLIFTRPNSQNQIIEKIKQKASPRYRLFLWKSFIQAVEPVDSSMAFLAYRTMIYSFQDNIIPIITE